MHELPLGGEDPLGWHALRFTGECAQSARWVELVTLPTAARLICSARARSPAPDQHHHDGPELLALTGVASGPFVILRR